MSAFITLLEDVSLKVAMEKPSIAMDRPNPKPPFDYPIQDITLMRVDPWKECIEKSGYDIDNEERCEKILEGIQYGVRIDYTGAREVGRYAINQPNALSDPVVKLKVTKIIEEDVSKGKKAGPFSSRPFPNLFCSPIGAVPKKGGNGVRVVHNLSAPLGHSINDEVIAISCSLGKVDDATNAIKKFGRGCFLVKLDVEAAYKQVAVHPDDRHLLGFTWEGKYYFELSLPFGLRSSCRIWEWFATALHFFFEKLLDVPVVVHYIDDFLFVIQTKERAHMLLNKALTLCVVLGIPLSAAKIEGPATLLPFLGIELDTNTLEIRLPKVKLEELKELLIKWRDKRYASVRQLQSLAGKLNHAARMVRSGRSYLRRIIDQSTRMLKEFNRPKQPYSCHRIQLDGEWWIRHIESWNGTSMMIDEH